MSLWKIAFRSIQQRSLASLLTSISMALGVTLVVAVLTIHSVVGDSFRNNASLGYNMIVGAKGGNLDMVLNTVYYLSKPVENIPYSYYKEFTGGKFKLFTELAVPVCLGDYYQNYRVVGTTPDMFNALQYGDGKKYTFSAGENFKQENYFDGVIGATVAKEANLHVGSKFNPTHGVGGHEHDPFAVVGILAPTGTPNDRALFVNMEGFYMLADHARPVEETPEAPKPAASKTDEHAAGHDEHQHDHDHDAHDAHMDADGHEHTDADHDHADHDHEGLDHAEQGEHSHEPAGAANKPAALGDHDDTEPATQLPAEDKSADCKPPAHDEHEDHDHDHAGHDHAHHHEHKPLPEEQREVTAILVRTTNDIYTLDLLKTINKSSTARAVLPILEITRMFQVFVDPLQWVLLGLTITIVLVSGISILVSIYNSMSDRRHEIAVMRALGARRRTVMAIVLFESILLSLFGGIMGWLLGHTLVAALSPYIAAQTGVSVGFFQLLTYHWVIMDGRTTILIPYEVLIIVGLVALASLVGFLPAMAAYRTDVAKALSSSP